MGAVSIAFAWDNLGPSHHDRLRATHLSGFEVTAIELFSTSSVYNWERGQTPEYPVVTLAETSTSWSAPRLGWHLFRAVRRSGAKHAFLCHYSRLAVFMAAWMLKISGCNVYTMLDSKFDDVERHWFKTLFKVLALTPYRGALIASKRSRAYVSYLGIPRARTAEGYDTLDLARLRNQSAHEVRAKFADRPFLAVARLVELKNLHKAISAFASYRHQFRGLRQLQIVGSGPEKDALRRQAEELGVAGAIEFLGARSSAEVTGLMKGALALLLPSRQETFGIVVLEAMAMGLPVIVSQNAGATDCLVDNLLNGFLINPEDERQLLTAMLNLDRDEELYSQFSKASLEASERGDVKHFVTGVKQLANL